MKEAEQISLEDVLNFFDKFFVILSSTINDVLNNFRSNHIEYIKQYESSIQKQIKNESIRKEINSFLSLAKDDLQDFKILINEKSYHNAIYHLQQSAEKTIKVLHFFIIVDFKPKKDIGHDFSKIIPLLKKNVLISDFLKESIIELESRLNMFPDGNIKLFGNKKIDLSNFWNDIDEERFLKDFKKRMINIFANNDFGIGFALILIFLRLRSQIRDMSNNKGTDLNNILYSSELYIFNMILSPHEELTRYPSGNSSKMNPKDYYGCI